MKWLFRLWKLLARIPGMQILLLRLLNARFIVGASAVILDDDARVLLFHHTYRDKYAWGLPGGWLKRGENAPLALAREVAEESGLAVDIVAPLVMETVPHSRIIEMIYLARFVGGEFLPSAEVDRCGWFQENFPDKIKPIQARTISHARRLHAEASLPGKMND